MAFSTEEQKRRWPPGILSGGQIGTYSLSEPQAGSEFGAGQCGKAGGHRRRDGGHRQGEEMSTSGCASKCVASSASRSVIWRLSPTMMPTAARVVAANAAVTGAGAVSCRRGAQRRRDLLRTGVDMDSATRSPAPPR
jgi:hypothetical protein